MRVGFLVEMMLTASWVVVGAAFAPTRPAAYLLPAVRSSLMQREMVPDELFPVAIFSAAVAGTMMVSSNSAALSKQVESLVVESSPMEETEADPIVGGGMTQITEEVSPVLVEGKNKLSQDISKMRKEVASTIEGEMEKEARMRKAELKRQEDSNSDSSVETTDDSLDSEEATDGVGEETEGEKRGVVRKGLRVFKKVVAPWRKWKNIK